MSWLWNNRQAFCLSSVLGASVDFVHLVYMGLTDSDKAYDHVGVLRETLQEYGVTELLL